MKQRCNKLQRIFLLALIPMHLFICEVQALRPQPFDVKIGVITYSWRTMPESVDDIISYCQESGIHTLELMGNVAETYAGLPTQLPRMKKSLSEKEKIEIQEQIKRARAINRKWRLSVSMEKYVELREKFKEAGVDIHCVKFNTAKWTDEEMDYAFRAAKALGAKGVSNEIGESACKRMGIYAERHNMYAVFHNHRQPRDPNFSFDTYLNYSPNKMLNFDIGDYWGATAKTPTDFIKNTTSVFIVFT